MEKIRQVIAYRNFFEDFLLAQPVKVQDKIYKIIEAIETLERIPANYLKFIQGTKGLYEARIQLGSDIWRVFCFFDQGKLVILLNGFVKKTQKTPRKEIDKALRLMNSYYEEKNKKKWKQNPGKISKTMFTADKVHPAETSLTESSRLSKSDFY
jgi:phage-related protein